MSAWLIRARDLGIISENRYVEMYKDFSIRGWRKNEPEEYLGDEQPTQLKRLAQLAISQGAISLERLSNSGADFLAPVAELLPEGDFPSATELMEMDEAERDSWMEKMFDLAEGMEFEVFEAFGEEEF